MCGYFLLVSPTISPGRIAVIWVLVCREPSFLFSRLLTQQWTRPLWFIHPHCHSKPVRLSFHPTLKDFRLFILLFFIKMHRHGQFQAPGCYKIPLRYFIPCLLKSNWTFKSLFTSDHALCGSKFDFDVMAYVDVFQDALFLELLFTCFHLSEKLNELGFGTAWEWVNSDYFGVC